MGTTAADPDSASPEGTAAAVEPVIFGVSRQALAQAATVARLRRAGGALTLELMDDGLRVEARNAEVAAGIRLACAQAPNLSPGERVTITLDPDLMQLLAEPRLVPDSGAPTNVDIRFTLPRPGNASPIQGLLAGPGFEHTFPFAFAEPLPPMPEPAGDTVTIVELREVLALLDGYAVADPDHILHSQVRLGPTAVWAHHQDVGRVLTGFSIAGIDACLTGPAAKDLRALLRLFDPVHTRIAATDTQCVFTDANGWCRVALEAVGLPRALTLGSPVVRLTLASDAFERARTQILALEEISHGLVEVAVRSGPPAELAFSANLPAGEATARCPALETKSLAGYPGSSGEEAAIPTAASQEECAETADVQEDEGANAALGQAGRDALLEPQSVQDLAVPQPGPDAGNGTPEPTEPALAAAPLEPIVVEAPWLAKLTPAGTSASVELVIGPHGLCLVETDGMHRIETFVQAKRLKPQD